MTSSDATAINATSLDGHSYNDIIEQVAAMIDTGNRQTATRPPDARYDLTGRQPCTVISVSDDTVFVQLDADDPSIITPAEPGADASPQQRGFVLTSPSGGIVWIGSTGIAAPSGPVQVASWPAYVPVTDATLSNIENGTLEGNYIQVGPTVHFSIDLLFGGLTSVPTFRLPTLPVARRFVFIGTFSTAPAGAQFAVIWTSVADGSSRQLFSFLFSDGTSFLPTMLPLSDARPGGFTRGAGTRLAITGTYESAT